MIWYRGILYTGISLTLHLEKHKTKEMYSWTLKGEILATVNVEMWSADAGRYQEICKGWYAMNVDSTWQNIAKFTTTNYGRERQRTTTITHLVFIVQGSGRRNSKDNIVPCLQFSRCWGISWDYPLNKRNKRYCLLAVLLLSYQVETPVWVLKFTNTRHFPRMNFMVLENIWRWFPIMEL